MQLKNNGVWVSWNENIKHPYKNLFTPETEEEIADIVKKSDTIRFFGNKQSSADIAAGNESLIDMNRFNKITHIDKTNKRITIQSGAKLVDLIEAVENENWCIPCLPDINTVTVGGAIATGTHGTSGKLLSEYIFSCKLIKADGEIESIESNSDLLNAVRVSLGTLGIITEITFQCEDIYYLHLKEGPEKDEVWLNNFQTDLKKFDFLRILWLPHTGYGYSIKGKKVAKDFNFKKVDGPSFLKHRRTASKILYKYTHRFPKFTVIANKLLYSFFFKSKKEHLGSLYQATVTKSRGSTLELAEWTIDQEKFKDVFTELKQTINSWKNNAFIHIPMDVRFLNADTSWLSYAYKKNIVTMGCVCRNAAAADNYEAFKTVEEIFLKHGGRPHWAKRFAAKDKEMAKIYPKWEEFKTLRKQMDPKNKFLNSYLKDLLNE